MSKTIYNFELKETSTEHHLISKSPNLIITTQGEAGVADVFMASKWGEYNHVAGFVSGEDKIQIPLAVIQDVVAATAGASLDIVKGALPAERFIETSEENLRSNSTYNHQNQIVYTTDGGGKLYFVTCGDNCGVACLLTLDAKPALSAGDIEIV